MKTALQLSLSHLRIMRKTLQQPLFPTFSFSLPFSGRTEFFCVIFYYCCCRRVWLISNLSTRHAVWFMPRASEMNSTCTIKQSCGILLFNHQELYISHITKLGRVKAYHEGIQAIMSHDSLIVWFCEITWQITNIFTTIMPMFTKFGRVVTYLEGFPLIKSHDPLITRLCEMTWTLKLQF